MLLLAIYKDNDIELVKNLNQKMSLLIVLLALLTLLGLAQFGQNAVGFVKSLLPTTSPPSTDFGQVVIQIRNATDLSTAVYSTETVIPVSQDTLIGQIPIGTTRLLYIARGEARAGIDFSEIQAKDVNIGNGTVKVVLPPPHIIDSKIDVERSRIYEHSKDWFGPNVESALHEQAEQEALREITSAACQAGLLESASKKAQGIVVQLLDKVGYKDVSVEVRKLEANACVIPKFQSGVSNSG